MNVDESVRKAFPKLSDVNAQAAALHIASMLEKQHVDETLPTLPLQVLFDRVPVPPNRYSLYVDRGMYDPHEFSFLSYTFRKLCNTQDFYQECYAIQAIGRVRHQKMVLKTVPIGFAEDYDGTVGDWLDELEEVVCNAEP